METHFYTTEIFFSFMKFFLYTFRNISYNFFKLFSYFQNNECKKSRNSRGKTRAMESHFYSMDFFFLSRKFSKIHSQTFFTISFLCCFRISRIMNAKKLEIREGRQEQWNSTSTAWIFFPLSREFSYIHSETFLTIVYYSVFVFPA